MYTFKQTPKPHLHMLSNYFVAGHTSNTIHMFVHEFWMPFLCHKAPVLTVSGLLLPIFPFYSSLNSFTISVLEIWYWLSCVGISGCHV